MAVSRTTTRRKAIVKLSGTRVVPVHRGAGEFACDGVNGFVVDTRDDAAIVGAVAAFLGMTTVERGEMRANGIVTGFRYSPEAAATAELRLLPGPSGRA